MNDNYVYPIDDPNSVHSGADVVRLCRDSLLDFIKRYGAIRVERYSPHERRMAESLVMSGHVEVVDGCFKIKY